MLESGAELVTHCSFLLPYFYPTNLLEKMAKDISLDLQKEAEAAGGHVDEEHENGVVHEVVNRHGDARPEGNSQLPGPDRERAEGHALQDGGDGYVPSGGGDLAIDSVDGPARTAGIVTAPHAGGTEQEEEHMYVFGTRGRRGVDSLARVTSHGTDSYQTIKSRSAGGDANERVRDAMFWSTKLNGWVLDLKSEDQREYGSINKNTNDCDAMTQLPSGTMVNLGGESKQELFDGGLVWCDERAMWARKTRTARLRRLHTCEVTNNGRDDGTNLAVRETVRDGCMRWKGKPVDVWKLAASAKQTDAKDKYVRKSR
ncbi:hypothetical protein PC120_g23427 [Phytophthora cactorum]|nr:hypothetical protein PC120_g23427 [Phytophthora cactorum]